MTASGESTK